MNMKLSQIPIRYMPLHLTLRMTSKDYKKIITDKIKEVLKPRHFKKTGNNFKFSNGDLTYYVGLQSSTTSTATFLKATVNIGIGSELLYRLEEKYITSHLQGHFSKRIGDYLEQPYDKWWTIDNEEAATSAAHEIAEIIKDKVLVEFDRIKTTEDLVSYWKQDNYAGLTVYQLKEYYHFWTKQNYSVRQATACNKRICNSGARRKCNQQQNFNQL
jgi:hypothetical protein